LEHLVLRIQRSLYHFARDSLKPTVLAAVSLARLKAGLVRFLGRERAEAALGELAMGARPDPEADLPAAIRDLASGRLDRAAFLERFGHRGSQEMELAQPRWAETPDADVMRALARGSRLNEQYSASDPQQVWRHVVEEAKLPASKRATLEPEVQLLHTYLGLRETAKHYFMKGYALIRQVLVELDRRCRLHGGIFYLTLEELPDLAAGKNLSALITQRRWRRTSALSLEVPQVLFSDDLEAIGRPVDAQSRSDQSAMQGVPLSAGVAEGPALVLHEPNTTVSSGEPYILVCPSTDPAWVPLFVQARGLVMETGGVLSHGAIVAREFGLPAVAGLPDIQRRLRSGQRLRVDGATGKVTVLTDIS
jgi:pyruvate,water dikinase